jgi:hypothetical protein
LSCIQLRESLQAALMTTAQSEEKEKRLYYIALTWMYPTHFDRHLFFFFSFFYYFHAIYIEREKASITLFLSLIRLDRQLLVSSFDAEWVRCCSCLLFFCLFLRMGNACAGVLLYIYAAQRPTLRIVLPLPLWLDRQLHHSKCVCCAFDALCSRLGGHCNNQMMEKQMKERWTRRVI